MIEFAIAASAAVLLFLIRRYLYRPYAEGAIPALAPALGFGAVWGALPFAGAVAALWPFNTLTLVLGVLMFTFMTLLSLFAIPRVAARDRRFH